MQVVLSNQAGVPIYQQIENQVKTQILNGDCPAGMQLPSIRELAKDLKISVITTTRAYRDLEAQGYVTNMQGKGTFVAPQDNELIREHALRAIENGLQTAIDAARLGGVETAELHTMLDTLLEGENDG
ncbi:GntR family transcriptional regulator [Lacticaseibacillus mingshuiensis]|uniref:GntR family transcriptional regulator n=1 Tax=Lacticaseibacillus mingshuiensis TaxID=2799574 RepID=UPI0019515B43|nr:GntR family transcriptional regulator [Lacticaseibacillus mingshuiensis]